MPLEYQRKTNLLDHDDFSRLAAGDLALETLAAVTLSLESKYMIPPRPQSETTLRSCSVLVVRAGSIPLNLTINDHLWRFL